MKYSITVGKNSAPLIPNKEFSSYSEAIAWFRSNFICDADLCIEEVREKRFKVVYHELRPNYQFVTAKDEREAINTISSALKKQGITVYEFVNTIEVK